MRKIIWSSALLVAVGLILYGSILYIKDFNTFNHESDITGGKDIGKEEYIYTEELLSLGYNSYEINIIKNSISEADVKNYMLSEKFDNLDNYLDIPYFKTKNIKRYIEYAKKHADYPYEQVVLYVEIGIDNVFYTNVVEVSNQDSINVLVNKYNKLPSKYEPSDLVTLDEKYGSAKLRNVAADAFIKMAKAAKNDGYNIKVINGYRSELYQQRMFDKYLENNTFENVLKLTAKPGFSEHQTGLAVDINNVENSFTNSKEYKWLQINAREYGFIERYPKDKEYITGYTHEPWHYRYVGIDIAKKLHSENITFEEYVVKYNK